MSGMVKIRDVVSRDTGTRNPTRQPDESFEYVDVAAINNESKTIDGARTLLGADAPSRARRLIQANDVLVSTVRPNLNAVALVPERLGGQVASTGFCVLRANGQILPQYLYYFTRSRGFVENLSRLVAGALYPAVTDGQVLDQEIPMVSPEKQRDVVDSLAAAESIVRLCTEASEKTAELLPVMFVEMYGDPATNPKGWPFRQVSDFVEKFEGGKNLLAGSENGSPFRILKVSAVTSGRYLEEESKPTPDGYQPPAAHLVRVGDMLFSRANTEKLVGATALVESTNGRTLLPDKLWRIVWSEPAEPAYMHALFQSRYVRQELSRISTGTSSSMRNISQGRLFEVSLPVAPYDEQRMFGERATAIRSIQTQRAAALEKAQQTFDALMAAAFPY
ncbi:hypothetical protein [Paraburkholderia sp. JHI869]|uniref:restriction endonuclease subunit S n=1 Tax=Paraburkholderia sp. JHI869 TaxID=3112959 RepID=UPI00317842BB